MNGSVRDFADRRLRGRAATSVGPDKILDEELILGFFLFHVSTASSVRLGNGTPPPMAMAGVSRRMHNRICYNRFSGNALGVRI